MSQTITNPADPTKTYTYGQRGRKPLWVQAWEAQNQDKVEAIKKAKSGPVVAASKTGFYQWTFRGEQAQCIAIGTNKLDVLGRLNKTMVVPVTGLELDTHWKVEPVTDDTLTPGVWEFDKKQAAWITRPEKAR